VRKVKTESGIISWAISQEQLEVNISELEQYGLDYVVMNALQRSGVMVVGDLCNFTEEQLLGSGIGEARIESLRRCLMVFFSKKKIIGRSSHGFDDNRHG
jgi:DNA-directed RNA polymerase alpha subunit